MNPIGKLQKWMDSPYGQVFMNYSYSWVHQSLFWEHYSN